MEGHGGYMKKAIILGILFIIASCSQSQKQAMDQSLKTTALTGTKIEAEVNFSFDSSSLNNYSKTVLDQLVLVSNNIDEDYSIIVSGHTDQVGHERYNYSLARERAMNVKRYLQERGINEERIAIQTLGESDPVIDTFPAARIKANRRVEIEVIPRVELLPKRYSKL